MNPLTERQKEVLRLRAGGKGIKEIASDLSVSPKTVEDHWFHIKQKVGFDDVAMLTQYALHKGIATMHERVLSR